MGPRDEDQGNRHRRGTVFLPVASQRLYGALLPLYPKSFRRRYAAEMQRDFADLSREALEVGAGRSW
jgi:hypothetical protein